MGRNQLELKNTIVRFAHFAASCMVFLFLKLIIHIIDEFFSSKLNCCGSGSHEEFFDFVEGYEDWASCFLAVDF